MYRGKERFLSSRMAFSPGNARLTGVLLNWTPG
jgi:hypothetical protein